jgi:hypothetical protein
MLFLAPLLGLFLLAGCGGGGGSSPSPFVGSWSGSGTTAAITSQGQFILAFTVDSKGAIAGTWQNPPGSSNAGGGAVTGSVSNGGSITITLANVIEPNYPGNTEPWNGPTNIGQDGQWRGSLKPPVDTGSGFSLAIDMVKQ